MSLIEKSCSELLVLQAAVVALLGIETRNRPLEELRPELIGAGAGAPPRATAMEFEPRPPSP